MVVDVGGGTSEMAVISLGGIVISRSVRVGGYEMDEAITHYLRIAHSAGDRLADGRDDQDRDRLGHAAAPRGDDRGSRPPPRHRPADGGPAAQRGGAGRDRGARCGEIVQAIRDTLEETPPELASDIARDGILLAGGGTLMRGFPSSSRRRPGCRCTRRESPLTCVAFGSGQALEHFDELSRASRHRTRR